MNIIGPRELSPRRKAATRLPPSTWWRRRLRTRRFSTSVGHTSLNIDYVALALSWHMNALFSSTLSHAWLASSAETRAPCRQVFRGMRSRLHILSFLSLWPLAASDPQHG